MLRAGFGLVALLAGLLAPAPSPAQAPDPPDPPDRCVVAYVVDGDTFNCRDGTTVRLLMVDAPEGGRFGDPARRALATLLPVDTIVRLETDRRVRDGDDRLLAYVYLDDGRMVNDVLVRKGFAFFEPSPANRLHVERLRTAESIARQRGVGVWSN